MPFINALPVATTLAFTDVFPLDSNDETYQASGEVLHELLSPAFFPEDDGAVAGGATNCRTAIMAACARGPVDGRGRTYGISGSMELTDFTALRNIILVQLNPSADNCRTLQITNITNPVLENVIVNRGTDYTVGALADEAGIWVSGCTNITIRDNEVYGGGPGSGIVLTNCTGGVVEGNYVHDMQHNIGASDDALQGIWVDTCTKVKVVNNTIETLTPTTYVLGDSLYSRGIAISASDDCTFSGNTIDTVDQGFDYSGSLGNSRYILSDNNVRNCSTYGYKLSNSSHEAICSNNIASNCGQNAFVIAGKNIEANPEPKHFIVSGCMAINTGYDGAHLSNQAFRVMDRPTDDLYPQSVMFIGCMAVDNQAVKTMVKGFSCDVPAIEPTSTGYDSATSSVCINCIVIGATDASFDGIHNQAATLIGTGTANTSDSTWTSVDFAAADIYDPANLHSITTNATRTYCKIPGRYWVFGSSQFAANATGTRKIRFTVDGAATYSPEFEFAAHPTAATTVQGGTVVDLDAGQYVRMEVWQDSGGVITHNKAKSSMSIMLLPS